MRNLNSSVRFCRVIFCISFMLGLSFFLAPTFLPGQAVPAPSSQPASQGTSQSGSQAGAQAPSARSATVSTQAPITIQETLSSLRYDSRWEVYAGIGYERFKAGPNLYENSALGGFDVQGTRWLTQRLGGTVNARGYYGTSPAVPNTFKIQGPFVSNHFFMAGPELLGPHNIHAAVTMHVLAGGSYGRFNADLGPYAPAQLGLFNNQFNVAGDVGGSIDLNRSARYSLRIAPDMLVTHYGGSFATDFGISVGILYRFKGLR